MLESLMRATPKYDSKPKSPGKNSPKKVPQPVIPELVELQREILRNKPAHIVQFIRDWANSKLNKYSKKIRKEQNYSDDEDDLVIRNIKKNRRNAFRISNQLYEECQKPIKSEKLEETKSLILINLRKMESLKCLSNQQIWGLIEEFQERQYQQNQRIIQFTEPVRDLFIITSGIVLKRALNSKKIITLNQGSEFGQQSLMFQRKSDHEFISQSTTKVALLQGRRISNCVREANKQKYKIIYKAILSIDLFNKSLHSDEVDKIVQIGMNQQIIHTSHEQQINMDNHPSSLFVILSGKYNLYSKKLMEVLKKQPAKICGVGSIFGSECLFEQRLDFQIQSQGESSVIQIRSYDIQKILGPVSKLMKRRKQPV